LANLIVVGAQWGDEGKGKIVDLFTPHFDVVARYQGGHNAGHTVLLNGKKYVLHLIPSGILHPNKVCVVGNGVVIDLSALKQEIEELRTAGVNCKDRLFISNRAHLILPYHRKAEMLDEERRGENRIGTTNRGIGPAYEDKMGRRGLRICDLSNPESFRRLVKQGVQGTRRELDPAEVDSGLEAMCVETLALGDEMAEYFTDSAEYLNSSMDDGKRVLFEGAQGTLLDVDHGTYPFVTASNATAGGACTGTGVGPTRIDGVVGIAKAYTTRVGEGPLPTELTDALGESIRQKGMEFGASTGRPRRCGWFDAVVVNYARLINNLETLVITKLDVLDELPEIQICTSYRYKGKKLRAFPPDMEILEQCEPEYQSVRGWNQKTAGIQRFDDLPTLARDYLKRISDLVKAEISIVSTGPDRRETIIASPSSRLQSWIFLDMDSASSA
jgi:adenylosuccinate synthase